MSFFRSLFLFLAAALMVGCSNTRYEMITSERFPPKADPTEVRLYVNQVRRPHIKVAYVQSFSDLSRTDEEVRREQLLELRNNAARVGADAVMDIRQMKNQVRGFVQDERTPFRSYTQDRYETYFLRGVAIRFVEDEATAAAFADPARETALPPPTTETPGDDIPFVITRDPEDDLPMEVVPKGLGPR